MYSARLESNSTSTPTVSHSNPYIKYGMLKDAPEKTADYIFMNSDDSSIEEGDYVTISVDIDGGEYAVVRMTDILAKF